MEEVYETSLTAEHWIDADGNRPPLGTLAVEDDEVLDPEALQDVTPEEEFEGYTGNAGMTLDRWYRHAAVFLWPNKQHFEVLCDAGIDAISCTCADCSELKRFLNDPHEPEHRFRVAEARRSHLEMKIRDAHCDLNLKTERKGSPYTLVCTKNRASYQAKLDKFHQDQRDLATLRSIQASVPG